MNNEYDNEIFFGVQCSETASYAHTDIDGIIESRF